MKKTRAQLEQRIKELEQHFFLINGIVKAGKEVLAKQKPNPLMVDKGLAWEEWKLYTAIELYEKLMLGVEDE